MALGGRLTEDCAGRLLTAAAALDLLVVVLVVRLTGGYHGALRSFFAVPANVPSEVIWGAAFLLVLGLYWSIVEFFLTGQSLGRFALGLQLRARDGQPLSASKRIGRGIRKLGCMGLVGLSPTTIPPYDRACDAGWFSRMAPRASRPLKEWRIIVEAPGHPPQVGVFGQLRGFQRHKAIKIGRDPKWANLVLPPSLTQVSRTHCVLILRNGRIYLRDWGEGGKGSSSGTRLKGRQLRPGEWTPLGDADQFQVADIRIRLDR